MDAERCKQAAGEARPVAGGSKTGSPRSNLAVAIYGISAGIGTTALGAWSASGITGSGRIAVWITVTTVLSLGSVWLATPVTSWWIRPVRNERGLHHLDPPGQV